MWLHVVCLGSAPRFPWGSAPEVAETGSPAIYPRAPGGKAWPARARAARFLLPPACHKVASNIPKTLEVTCPLFTDGGQLPVAATVDGDGIPLPIQWSGVPEAARSLVVVCEDPDAPLSEPFVHWLVYAIPPNAHAVSDGARFVEGKSSAMRVGFSPAAPPPGHGVHHYHFQVFALDVPITLEAGSGRRALLEAMHDHVIGWGDLVGTYQRS